ncbi:MAG: hypothetical protein AB7V39_00415 [Nitrospiraceae bacterium]
MAKRGKKMARILASRIKAWEGIKTDKKAFKKPGAHPGDFAQRYGG